MLILENLNSPILCSRSPSLNALPKSAILRVGGRPPGAGEGGDSRQFLADTSPCTMRCVASDARPRAASRHREAAICQGGFFFVGIFFFVYREIFSKNNIFEVFSRGANWPVFYTQKTLF